MFTAVFALIGILIGFFIAANTEGGAMMSTFFGVLIGAPATFILAAIGAVCDAAESDSDLLAKKQAQMSALEKAITPHAEVLARKKKQLCQVDDYGNVDDTPWRKEAAYFFNKTIKSLEGDKLYLSADEIFEAIDSAAASHARSVQSAFDHSMTPYEYEHYCAEQIELGGWVTTVTKGSGDQGIDVIAKKNGLVVVIQCKLYSSPVGNKAVQEAHAGKGFIQADAAIVVTNNTFTPSARELASSLDVKLLHHDDLWKMEDILGLRMPT